VASLATDVIRDDRDGIPGYLLHCERSSGQYLFDAVFSAGADFGIAIDGFTAPGI
jgi:glycine cleavage system aminomethyltransferase T